MGYIINLIKNIFYGIIGIIFFIFFFASVYIDEKSTDEITSVDVISNTNNDY